MTAQARITQGDMERATKAVARAGYERARIVMDFAKQRIEVILGEPANSEPATADVWSDEDV